jgi:hypothetical protein
MRGLCTWAAALEKRVRAARAGGSSWAAAGGRSSGTGAAGGLLPKLAGDDAQRQRLARLRQFAAAHPSCVTAPPPRPAPPAAAAAATIAGPAATPHTGRRVAANAGLYRRGGFGSGVCVGRARTGRGSVDGSWSRAPAGAGAVGASDRADTAAERPTARGGGGGGGGPEAAIAAALRYHPRGGGGGTRRRHHHHGPCHRPVLAPGGAGRRARGCRSGCDHAKGMTACV